MALAVTNNISKIRDDLKASEDKFNIGSYLDANESTSFLTALPGLKDIIGVISGIVDKLVGFADMVLGFIEKILNYLNLNTILDALGIKGLTNFIIDMMTGLIGMGFSLGIRVELLNLFSSSCGNMSDGFFKDGIDRNKLESFALMALILGLSCFAQNKAFSNFHNIMYHTPDIQVFRDTLIDVNDDLSTAMDFPVQIYDDNTKTYIIDQTATDAKLKPMQDKIIELNSKIQSMESRIDTLFAYIGTSAITQLSTKNTGTIDSTVFLFSDIASVDAVANVMKNNNNNISSTMVYAYENTLLNIPQSTIANEGVITTEKYKDMVIIDKGIVKDNNEYVTGVGSNLSIPKQISVTCRTKICDLAKDVLPVSNGKIIDPILASFSKLDKNIPSNIFADSPRLKAILVNELRDVPITKEDLTINSNIRPMNQKIRYLA